MESKKGFAILPVLILLTALAVGAAGYVMFFAENLPDQIACTMEAKLCPDGTAVGRTGPNCEFAECLGTTAPLVGGSPPTIFPAESDKTCKTDTDCVVVRNHCGVCGFSTVGSEYETKYKNLYDSACEGWPEAPVICVQRQAICERNTCVLKGDQSINISDWQTYRNEEYGFEFKHPGQIKVSEFENLHTHGINLTFPSGSLVGYIKGPQYDVAGTETTVVINDQKYNMWSQPFDGGELYRILLDINEQKELIFRNVGGSGDLNLFFQILSTFRFIEPDKL